MLWVENDHHASINKEIIKIDINEEYSRIEDFTVVESRCYLNII